MESIAIKEGKSSHFSRELIRFKVNVSAADNLVEVVDPNDVEACPFAVIMAVGGLGPMPRRTVELVEFVGLPLAAGKGKPLCASTKEQAYDNQCDSE